GLRVDLHPLYAEQVVHQPISVKGFIIVRLESRGPNQVNECLCWRLICTKDQLVIRTIKVLHLDCPYDKLILCADEPPTQAFVDIRTIKVLHLAGGLNALNDRHGVQQLCCPLLIVQKHTVSPQIPRGPEALRGKGLSPLGRHSCTPVVRDPTSASDG